MRELFTKFILLPVTDIIKRQKVTKYFNQYQGLLTKSRAEVEEIQNMKIRDLVNHAYNNTVYYREVFDNLGLKPQDIKEKQDLQLIPCLTRDILQDRFNDLIDRNSRYKGVTKGSSSGSTGKPVFYLHDEYSSSAGAAAQYFGWYLSGYRFGHKGLHIWGNPTIVKNIWSKPSSKLKSKLYNHYKFPAYQLSSTKKFEELYHIIEKGKFKFLDGYSNTIYLLAVYLDNHNISLNGIKNVFTTAENLHEYQRELIEKRIGTVYDNYGCGEITGIAYETGYGKGYAIMDTHVTIEFDAENPTNDGNFPLIITNLDSRAMPMIRYKNGDLGRPVDKNQTSELPLSFLQTISGRTSDIIKLPGGGSLVVPSFFGSVLLKEIRSIRQYQVVRVLENELIIKFVLHNQLTFQEHQTIRENLDNYLQGEIGYSIQIVDKIEQEANGKYKLMIDRTQK